MEKNERLVIEISLVVGLVTDSVSKEVSINFQGRYIMPNFFYK
jgi:hypothetical protein